MNWQNVSLIAASCLFLPIIFLRVEKGVRWLIFALLILPAGVLFLRWAAYREAWLEMAVGAGIGFMLLGAWWLLVGRKLPPPRSSIKVWTKDDPF